MHLETFMSILFQDSEIPRDILLQVQSILKVCSRGLINIMVSSKKGKVIVFRESVPGSDIVFDEFFNNPKTTLQARRRGLLKQVLKELGIKIDKDFLNSRIFAYHLKCFECAESEMNFEDIDTYHRLHIYRHLAKTRELKKVFGKLDNLLSVKNIYKQILYHKSYMRFRS